VAVSFVFLLPNAMKNSILGEKEKKNFVFEKKVTFAPLKLA